MKISEAELLKTLTVKEAVTRRGGETFIAHILIKTQSHKESLYQSVIAKFGLSSYEAAYSLDSAEREILQPKIIEYIRNKLANNELYKDE